MSARRNAAIDALAQAARRAATGSDVRTTAWTPPDAAAALVAAIRPGALAAASICDAEGVCYFLADYSEADGPDIAR